MGKNRMEAFSHGVIAILITFASLPVATYGVVLLFSAFAYYILIQVLLAHHPKDSALARAIGDDFKGRISVVVYVVAIPLALARPGLACALYVAVALTWLVPDRRIEAALAESGGRRPEAEP